MKESNQPRKPLRATEQIRAKKRWEAVTAADTFARAFEEIVALGIPDAVALEFLRKFTVERGERQQIIDEEHRLACDREQVRLESQGRPLSGAWLDAPDFAGGDPDIVGPDDGGER